MQFNVIALTFAAMAAVASATETTTVYACPTSLATSAGVATATVGTVGSTGVVTSATSTGSPIAYATGAASMNGVSAFGMVIAGGVALFL